MTNEDIFTELWYEAHNLNITEKVREQYIIEIETEDDIKGIIEYQSISWTKKEFAKLLKTGDVIYVKNIKENMAKYKIEITPLHSDTGERPELPYVIELQTDDIEWSMDQYQRNRKPFEWKVLL